MSRLLGGVTVTFVPAVLALVWAHGGSATLPGMCALVSIVEAIKRLTGVLRPDGTDRESFPSGHAAVSWYLFAIYGGQPPLLAPWALAVSIARVTRRRHWIRDVLAGGSLGLLVGHLVRGV